MDNNSSYILITGVSTGIGHALAKHFLAQGCCVIGTTRKETDATDITQDTFYKIIYDVTDKSGLEAFTVKIKNILKGQPLKALINNAGIAKAGPLEFVTDQDFELQMEVNVIAVRRITNAILPLMIEDSRIVNMSSVSGLFNSPFTGPYCISKHALESMSDIYRRELALFGIKVIAIEPGPIKTPIWGKARGTFDAFLNTRYGSIAPNADKMIDNAEKNALEVDHVVKACHKAVWHPKPKSRYLVHKKKWLFKLVSHYLPDSLVDNIVQKNLKKGDKHRAI